MHRSIWFWWKVITIATRVRRRQRCAFAANPTRGESTGFAFCHYPRFVQDASAFAGHLHPAVRLHGRADASIRLPCFWLREGLTVLPAFGAFTGGATIDREQGDRVIAVAEDRVVEVPAPRYEFEASRACGQNT